MGGVVSAQRSSETANLVRKEIQSAHAVLFVKKSCPYCTRAVSILRSYMGSTFTPDDMHVIDIEGRSDCSAIQDYLKSITGARTVPRIFIGGQCIGGCSDLEQLHKNQSLSKRLSQTSNDL